MNNKIKIIIFLAFFTSFSFAVRPTVSRVRVSQRVDSKLVDIFYNLRDRDSPIVTVMIKISADNGHTWNVPVRSLEGDYGKIVPAKDLHVIWDAGKDYDMKYGSGFRCKIVAVDLECPDANDAGMVVIDKGNYIINGKEVKLSSFCIDKWEYPNVIGEEPTVNISYSSAVDSCELYGKQLCTEVQLQLACMGKFERNYPYGSLYDATKCNTETSSINTIGDNTSCKSYYGVYDLSGNVYEWASDWHNKKHFPSSAQNPKGVGYGKKRVIKGGNSYLGNSVSKCNSRASERPSYANDNTGFRCCSKSGRD